MNIPAGLAAVAIIMLITAGAMAFDYVTLRGYLDQHTFTTRARAQRNWAILLLVVGTIIAFFAAALWL